MSIITIKNVFLVPAIFLCLVSASSSVIGDAQWSQDCDAFGNPANNTNKNWTNSLHWRFFNLPDSNSSENVKFLTPNICNSIINRDWTLSAISFDNTRGRLTFTSGTRLTLHNGITYTDRELISVGNNKFCLSGTLEIRVPISLGADAGFETTNAECTGVPLRVYSPINNNGNVFAVVANGSPIELRGTISGNGELRKQGSGEAILFSANSFYTGNTVIQAGILQINSTGRLPNASDIVINAGGRLLYNITPGAADAINGLFGSGSVGISGTNNLVIGNSDGSAKGNGNYSGSFDGDGALTKRGSTGTQTLRGLVDIAGPIVVEQGTLLLAPGFEISPARHNQLNMIIQSSGNLISDVSTTLKSMTVDNTATLSARINLMGDLILANQSTLSLKFEGASNHGAVNADNAFLDGSLELEFNQNHIQNGLQEFDLITANSIIGNFDQINGPTIDGVTWETQLVQGGGNQPDILRLTLKSVRVAEVPLGTIPAMLLALLLCLTAFFWFSKHSKTQY